MLSPKIQIPTRMHTFLIFIFYIVYIGKGIKLNQSDIVVALSDF